MRDTEHILLESDDRTAPDPCTARKSHAQCAFRSRLRNRTLQLEIIDFHYLSVKLGRARSTVSEYVLACGSSIQRSMSRDISRGGRSSPLGHWSADFPESDPNQLASAVVAA
jgi:hypothetical protein